MPALEWIGKAKVGPNMITDVTQKSIIAKINKKIQNSEFDEVDICTLLIMIRDLAPENRDYQKTVWETGCLHEICDFIAHRKRNRGLIVEEANYIYKHSTTTGVLHTEIESKREVVSGLYEDAIISEINTIFKSLGLESIPDDNEQDIILCIIALLQMVEYRSSQGVVGYLYSAIYRDSIVLWSHTQDAGVGLNILCAYKKNLDIPRSGIELIDTCFGLERKDGVLSIIIPDKETKANSFVQGK